MPSRTPTAALAGIMTCAIRSALIGDVWLCRWVEIGGLPIWVQVERPGAGGLRGKELWIGSRKMQRH